MTEIMKAYASIQYVEGKERATQKGGAMLAQWSQKWSASAPDILNRYSE